MADVRMQFPVLPRAIRPAPDPMGLYIRPGYNDHKVLEEILLAGDASWFGVVFDPTAPLMRRQKGLRTEVLKRFGEVILDPKTQQSALPGGFTKELGNLPWGMKGIHRFGDFEGAARIARIAALGDFAMRENFTAILAPTHFIRSSTDPWFASDLESTRQLREFLNKNGGDGIDIYYSLALPYAIFQDPVQRAVLIDGLRGLPIAALWLRVEGMGSKSTAPKARNYIEGAFDFQTVGVPVIADQMGGLPGVALLAFGAAGGLVHGVTSGEQFDPSDWKHARKPGEGYAPVHRVYFHNLDLMLTRKEAEIVFSVGPRARATFACMDTDCCRRGEKDMLENPGRHFLNQRMKVVQTLSQIPQQLRPQEFLLHHVLPVAELAEKATRTRWKNDGIAAKMLKQRKRFDLIAAALRMLLAKGLPQSTAPLPRTRAAREQ